VQAGGQFAEQGRGHGPGGDDRRPVRGAGATTSRVDHEVGLERVAPGGQADSGGRQVGYGGVNVGGVGVGRA
jgi:hypothetical protein